MKIIEKTQIFPFSVTNFGENKHTYWKNPNNLTQWNIPKKYIQYIVYDST